MKKIILWVALAVATVSCQQKENLSSESIFDTKSKERTELDQYIYENFQKPYNIEINYRWKNSEFEQGKYLYPPSEDKVKPLLEIVKKVWIDPYVEVAGANFIKLVAPRQIALVGGSNVNRDGTITLGFADGGIKIVLFNVDQLDISDEQATRRYFHTIQHEYCHIINQTKDFERKEFQNVTPSGYTASWFNVRANEANAKGFITPYSMANVVEDFAEMTSAMLNGSKADFDARVEAIEDQSGRELIRRKEVMVVEYFKKNWNIDIYQLQETVERQMQEVLAKGRP